MKLYPWVYIQHLATSMSTFLIYTIFPNNYCNDCCRVNGDTITARILVICVEFLWHFSDLYEITRNKWGGTCRSVLTVVRTSWMAAWFCSSHMIGTCHVNWQGVVTSRDLDMSQNFFCYVQFERSTSSSGISCSASPTTLHVCFSPFLTSKFCPCHE